MFSFIIRTTIIIILMKTYLLRVDFILKTQAFKKSFRSIILILVNLFLGNQPVQQMQIILGMQILLCWEVYANRQKMRLDMKFQGSSFGNLTMISNVSSLMLLWEVIRVEINYTENINEIQRIFYKFKKKYIFF